MRGLEIDKRSAKCFALLHWDCKLTFPKSRINNHSPKTFLVLLFHYPQTYFKNVDPFLALKCVFLKGLIYCVLEQTGIFIFPGKGLHIFHHFFRERKAIQPWRRPPKTGKMREPIISGHFPVEKWLWKSGVVNSGRFFQSWIVAIPALLVKTNVFWVPCFVLHITLIVINVIEILEAKVLLPFGSQGWRRRWWYPIQWDHQRRRVFWNPKVDFFWRM